MSFKIEILPDAQLEVKNAFEYYAQFSSAAIVSFNNQLEEVYSALEKNPFFQIRYKNLRAIPFKSYPFLIFFTVDEDQKIVFIYSVFNTYLDTKKYPKI